MKSWLYDCRDLETGEIYEGLPSGRLIQILGNSTHYKQASNLFKYGQQTHTVANRYFITRYPDDGMDSANALWNMYPDWARRFSKEWIAVCERIRCYG